MDSETTYKINFKKKTFFWNMGFLLSSLQKQGNFKNTKKVTLSGFLNLNQQKSMLILSDPKKSNEGGRKVK